MKNRIILGALSLLTVAACSSEGSTPASLELAAAFDHDPASLGTVNIGEFNVCKAYSGAIGPAAVVDWSVVRESGVPGASGQVLLADGECQTVYVYANDGNSNNGLEQQTVTVTEQPIAGYTTSFFRSSQATAQSAVVHEPEASGNVSGGVMISNPDNAFRVVFVNTEIPSLPGRMTGGGSIFDASGARFTHGFELHCDPTDEPNRLQINWGGNRFHLEELNSALCTDDPSIDPGQPKAGFDTYTGSGVGRLNGVSGATIDFRFTDAGEPGKNDFAAISITPAGGGAAIVSANTLDRGNHQAHK